MLTRILCVVEHLNCLAAFWFLLSVFVLFVALERYCDLAPDSESLLEFWQPALNCFDSILFSSDAFTLFDCVSTCVDCLCDI